MKDTVSIVVPIYNVEKYLQRCVDSLLNQTYEEVEILLVDDCSTDGSFEIARKYEEKYPEKCKYIKRETNGGLAAARNSGIKEATGTWLGFVDSDDWIENTCVEKVMKVAKEEASDIVVFDFYKIWDDGKKVRDHSLNYLSTASDNKLKVALIRNHACMKFFRKEFFLESHLMFPEDLKRAEDMGIIVPLLTKTTKISILDEPVYYYYQRSQSLSNSKCTNFDFYKSAFALIEKNSNPGFEEEIEYRAILEMVYGMCMLMIVSKNSTKQVKEHLKEIKSKYPNWKKNQYLKYCNKAKRLFVWLAGNNRIWMMRLLVKIREIL